MAKRPSNRLVRKSIREVIEPAISDLGFTGKYPEFRRSFGDETHFLLFQPRKYGGGFSISAAWCKRGPFTHWDGVEMDEDEVAFIHTPFEHRASLLRTIPMGIVEEQRIAWRSAGDYDYAFILTDEDACLALAQEAALDLPLLDHWLKTKQPGRGIDCTGHKMRTGLSKQFLWHCAAGMTGRFDLKARRPVFPASEQSEAATLAHEYWVDDA